ncbi:MAG TPA: transporter substrate-binding domain-containing protein [Pseudonocardiaceae bacterium]|jgi:glutamate transport system substrate-binding protein|nr:transporter substrate-binding domain-containing protein [Pseudonocardiaceae bacterium]
MTGKSTLVTALVGVTLIGSVLAGCGSAPTAATNAGGVAGAAATAQKIDQSAAVAAGPVGQNLPSTPTLDKIRQQGALVFAGARNGLGFSQLDPTTGKVSGFDEGIAELLAKYLLGKPNVKMSQGSSDTRETLLQNHTIDAAIETYTITPARAQLVNFAGPYYLAASGIVVKSTDSGITKVSDLAGKKVATESGAAKDALVAAAPTAQPVLFDTTAECITALEQGRVDAVTLNNALLLGAVATKPDVKMISATYSSNPFGIGLAKDDPRFKTIVNQFLNTIFTDGVWTTLWKDTVGTLLKTPPPAPPKLGSAAGS